MRQIISKESAAIISLSFGIFNLSVATGFLDLIWHDPSGVFTDFVAFLSLFGLIAGLKFGKDGLSSRRDKVALMGFWLNFFCLIYLIWAAFQIRDFHIY